MPAEYARPPEAELLYLARSGQHLSIREAARRAGISENRWRQVEAGYQTVRKGVKVPANATAATLASMARVVGLTPDRLEAEGQRPDAAGILREMQHQLVPPEASGVYAEVDEVAAVLYIPVLEVRLAELAGHGNHRPDGAEMFLEGRELLGMGESTAVGLSRAWDLAMERNLDLKRAVRYAARAWTLTAAYEARKASGAGPGSALVRPDEMRS